MAQQDIIREFLVRLGFKVDGNSLKNFTSEVEGASGMVEGLVKGLGALAATVASATAAFAYGMESVYFSSKRTGAGADSLTAFGAAAKNMGVDSQEAIGSVEALASAIRKNPGNESLINSLGVQTRRANGSLRDTVDIMADLGQELAKRPTNVGLQLGGMLGISERMFLAITDPGFTQELAKQQNIYKDSGLQKAAQDAHEFDVSVRNLTNTLKAGMVPVMTWLVDVFQSGLNGAEGWFSKNAGEITKWKDATLDGLKRVLTEIGGVISTLTGALGFYIDKIVEYSTKAYNAINKIIPESWRDNQNGPAKTFGEKFGWIGEGMFPGGDVGLSTPPGKTTSLGAIFNGGNNKAPTAKEVMDKLVSWGWTPEQAAGIAANLKHESGFNPNAQGDKDKNGNYQAYGMMQWHPDRQENFRRWSGHDIHGTSWEEQLAFLHYEATQGAERNAGAAIRATHNAREAGQVTSRAYVRPLRTDSEAFARGETAVQLSQSTTINVNGVKDPQTTANYVVAQQQAVNSDMTRNARQVVQ